MKDHRRKRDHPFLSWNRFFWCSLFLCISCAFFTTLLFSSFRFFVVSFHPVLVSSWRNPSFNAVNGDHSVRNRSYTLPSVRIQETVVFPDQVLIFLKYSPSAPPFTPANALRCVYFPPDPAQPQLKLPPVSIDGQDRPNLQIVRCPLPPRGFRVSLSRAGRRPLPSKTPRSWDSLAYEALLDGDNTTVVFVKGLNLRPERLANPSRFECVYGWDFTRSRFLFSSDALTVAQEIVRCKTPLILLKHPQKISSIKVTVRAKGTKGMLFPSLARPELGLGADAVARRSRRRRFDMCVCTMVRNQARFLAEWIIYHAHIGVQRWFIYDNNSDDGIADVVDSLSSLNYHVSRHLWPWVKTQEAGFAHCAVRAGRDCEWVGFIDVDEFLYLPSTATLPDVLRNHTGMPWVGELRTACHSFGPSGLRRVPEQGVTVGYRCRMAIPERHKSIVRPEALNSSLINVVHHFHLKDGFEYVNLDRSVMVSSVPVLDFQLVDDCDDVSVDAWNSNFNYSEVFGGFDGEDFAVYYEEKLAENLSETPRIPAEAGSKHQVPVFVPRIPTEELNGERFAGSDKSTVPSDAIVDDMHNGVNKSNVSLVEASRKSEQHSVDELTHMARCCEDSGYHSVSDGYSPSHISRYEKTKSQVADDPGLKVDFNGRSKGKDAKETLLVDTLGNELKADREQLGHKWTTVNDAPPTNQCHLGHPESGGNQSYPENAFLTISDINLQTQPLEVPPPSRPPPKIFVKQEDSTRKVTRRRKPYSEIAASSAAMVSVAAMREAMDKAHASLKCAKESMERKQDSSESHMKLFFDRQRKVDERSEGATAQKDHKFREDLSEEDSKRDTSKTKDFTGFEESNAMRPGHAAPDTEDKWGFIELGKESIVKRVGQDHRLMPQCSKMEEREQEWKAENQFDGLEKSEKSNSQDAAANGENPKWRATDKVQVEWPHETKVARKPVKLEKNDKSRLIQEDCMWEGKSCKLKVSHELEENVIRTKAALEAYEREENEVKVEVACRHGDMKPSVAKEVCKFGENGKNLYEDKEANIEQRKESELQAIQIIHLEGEYEKKPTKSVKHEREATKLNTTEEACQFDVRTEELKVTKMAFREDENKKWPETGQVIHDDDSSLKSAEDVIEWELNEKKTKAAEEDSDCAENEKETKMDEISCEHEKNTKKSEEAEVAHRECWNKLTLEKAQDFCQEDKKKLKAAHDVNGEWKNNQKVKTSEGVQQDGHGEKLEVTQEAHKREDNGITLKTPKVSSVKVTIEKLKTTEVAHEVVADKKNSWQNLAVLDRLSNKNKFKAAQEVFRRLESGKKSDATQWENPLKGSEDTFQAASEAVLNPKGGRKEENDCGMHKIEEDKGGSMPKERHLEKEWLRNVEGRESERERIKDWLAAGRVALETGDTAVAGAQKMVKSVIMERACMEVQTPEVVSEEREASAEACQKSLGEEAYMEVRVPTEQAAILRAQEHAMERTFSEQAISGEDDQVVRSTTEKFNVRGNNEMEESFELSDEADTGFKQGCSSADVEDFACGPEIQSATSCKSFQQYPNSATNGAVCSDEKFQGTDGESSKRFKARLARHQRMLERVAKALAEKNLRDILAQRELAERNRLAETLDAEVRRWSCGKEGNLRALLSTLQYILGPESGWKPIPLTDVITAVAVKKAYKKAALYVHPDKVQQRHANVQQKYICEKVFDLLKEAWNTFNSEER